MIQAHDPKLTEFLTNDQNVQCVLEVLKHGESVRTTLTTRFWSQLLSHLTRTAQARFSKNLKWTSGSNQNKKGKWAWLDAQFSNFKDQPQTLFHRIEYYHWPEGLILYYGIHWKAETRSSTPIRSSKLVQNLRQRLEEDG